MTSTNEASRAQRADAPRHRDDVALERAVLVTVGFGGMLIPLNSTMIAVAIPNITRELGATVTQSGWLVTAYLTYELGRRAGAFVDAPFALHALPDTGHWIQQERPDEVNELLLEFLRNS